jgi:hypothetical protein
MGRRESDAEYYFDLHPASARFRTFQALPHGPTGRPGGSREGLVHGQLDALLLCGTVREVTR